MRTRSLDRRGKCLNKLENDEWKMCCVVVRSGDANDSVNDTLVFNVLRTELCSNLQKKMNGFCYLALFLSRL